MPPIVSVRWSKDAMSDCWSETSVSLMKDFVLLVEDVEGCGVGLEGRGRGMGFKILVVTMVGKSKVNFCRIH